MMVTINKDVVQDKLYGLVNLRLVIWHLYRAPSCHKYDQLPFFCGKPSADAKRPVQNFRSRFHARSRGHP